MGLVLRRLLKTAEPRRLLVEIDSCIEMQAMLPLRRGAMLQIDLNAITVPLDQRVWRLFPGSGYQFLRDFIDQGVGFLDAPAFPLPAGKLSEVNDLVPRVAYSNSVRDRLYEHGSTAEIANYNHETYADARRSQARTRLANGLTAFLETARKGDLIVLPEPIQMSRVWVGRFRDDQRRIGLFPRRYGHTPIPGRSVEWLTSVAENTVSTALSQSLRHQHPFSLVEKSLQVEVLSLAFGSFVFGDRHVSTIYNDGEDFLDADAALLGTLGRLAAAASKAVDNGSVLNTADLLDILLRNPPIEYTCTQETDIHSPGFMRYIAGSTVPLVFAALVASLLFLSGCSNKQEMEATIQTIEYVNASDSSDPQCTARVSAASKQALAVLGTDRTWQLCEAARAARNRAKLRSTAKPTVK